MSKLRFCLAGEYPADTTNIGGGVQHVMYLLGETFAERTDIDFHIVTSSKENENVRVVERQGMTIHYVGVPARKLVPNMLTQGSKIAAVLGELRPDVINSHHFITTDAAVRAGCRVAHTIHGVIHREVHYARGHGRLSTGLLGHLECKAVSQANYVMSVAQYGLDQYARWIKAPTALINVPIEDGFAQVSPLTASSKGIVFAGGIGRRKNLRALVKAMPAVLRRHPEAALYVCGGVHDRRYRTELDEYAETERISEAVQFLGVVDRHKLAELISRSVSLVLPSYQETSPGVICQAMAAGRVAIASPVGGVPEMIEDGATGFLVEPDDSETLAARLIELLDDPDTAQRIGLAARKVALERYDRHKVADRILEVCSTLVPQLCMKT